MIPYESDRMDVIAILQGEQRKQFTVTQTTGQRDVNVGVLFPRVMEFPLRITSVTHEILHYGAGSPAYTIFHCKMKGNNKDIYVYNRAFWSFLNLEVER